jgi:uncharacterized cupin superfamily protein
VAEDAIRPLVTDSDADQGWERDEETGGMLRLIRETEARTVGLWKKNGVAGERIEYRIYADETLVVLQGSGEVTVNGGEAIQLRPGVVVSLPRGCELSWLVDHDFRELWIYS